MLIHACSLYVIYVPFNRFSWCCNSCWEDPQVWQLSESCIETWQYTDFIIAFQPCIWDASDVFMTHDWHCFLADLLVRKERASTLPSQHGSQTTADCSYTSYDNVLLFTPQYKAFGVQELCLMSHIHDTVSTVSGAFMDSRCVLFADSDFSQMCHYRFFKP